MTRPEGDDYDLLTYAKAGARLLEEIGRERGNLDELLASGADEGLLAQTRRRIADLQEAADRQHKAAAERADFRKFFGYDPTA
jgi:hypothetical protein